MNGWTDRRNTVLSDCTVILSFTVPVGRVARTVSQHVARTNILVLGLNDQISKNIRWHGDAK
jgi:hypothetical protein